MGKRVGFHKDNIKARCYKLLTAFCQISAQICNWSRKTKNIYKTNNSGYYNKYQDSDDKPRFLLVDKNCVIIVSLDVSIIKQAYNNNTRISVTATELRRLCHVRGQRNKSHSVLEYSILFS